MEVFDRLWSFLIFDSKWCKCRVLGYSTIRITVSVLHFQLTWHSQAAFLAMFFGPRKQLSTAIQRVDHWIIGRLGHHTTMSTDPFLSARCRVLVLHDESFLAGCILDGRSKDDQWDLFFFWSRTTRKYDPKVVHMSFVKAEENPAVSGHDWVRVEWTLPLASKWIWVLFAATSWGPEYLALFCHPRLSFFKKMSFAHNSQCICDVSFVPCSWGTWFSGGWWFERFLASCDRECHDSK